MPITPPNEGYYKARKSYLLTAAVLGVWELIGVTIEKLPIEDVEVGVVVRSPEAVPYALIVVLGYLAYRFSVEWQYCPDDTRMSRLSRTDFLVVHVLAIAAVLLFAYQSLSGVLVGSQLTEADVVPTILLSVGSVLLGNVSSRFILRLESARWRRILLIALMVAAALATFVGLFFFQHLATISWGVLIGSLARLYTTRFYSWTLDRLRRGSSRQ